MDCTIIILSYERKKFLLRAIEYWSNINVKLIIIHNTKKKIYINKSIKNVTYIKSNESYLDRIKISFGLIKTKYCLLAADDDFYILSQVRKAINFLEKHKDFRNYFGRVISFHKHNSELFYTNQYESILTNNLLSDNKSTRLKKLSNNYLPSSIYALSRTTEWIKCWSNVIKAKINVGGEHEILYEMFSAIQGKRLIHNDLTLVRSEENLSVQLIDSSINAGSLSNAWRENLIDKKSFINGIMQCSFSGIREMEINNFFNNYSKKGKERHHMKKKFIKNLKNIIKKLFPLIYYINSRLNILQKKKLSNLTHLKSKLLQSNINMNIKDIKLIDSIIKKSY